MSPSSCHIGCFSAGGFDNGNVGGRLVLVEKSIIAKGDLLCWQYLIFIPNCKLSAAG